MLFGGVKSQGLRPRTHLASSIGLVPQGRPCVSVSYGPGNLAVAQQREANTEAGTPWNVDRIYNTLFPTPLRERHAQYAVTLSCATQNACDRRAPSLHPLFASSR